MCYIYILYWNSEADMADTGAYKIEVTNESGAAACAFKLNVQGKS